MKFVMLFFFLLFCSEICSAQQYPDGTLVMSNKPGTIVGNIAKRMTGGNEYTHIAIIFDDLVYELDWPRVKNPVHFSKYGKPRTVNDYYIPIIPYTNQQANDMVMYAKSKIGQPYQLRNYLNPNSRKTVGEWCSPYVAAVLKSGGVNITEWEGREPQRILNKLRHNYKLITRVRR